MLRDYCTGIFDNDDVEHGAGPGIYFVSQWGADIFWFGRSKHRRQYANVAKGRVEGTQIILDWADIPLGSDAFAGQLIVESNIFKQTLHKVYDDSGFFGGITWKKRATPENKLRVGCPGLSSSIGKNFQTFTNGDCLEVLENCGLQDVFEAERERLGYGEALVNLYTRQTPLYSVMNRALRKDSPQLTVWGGYIAELQNALRSMEPFHGKVYRCIHGGSAADYPEDLEFYWPAFSSTTTRDDLDVFGELRFVIQIEAPAHCPHIARISYFTSEEEVLVPPYTKFRVLANTGTEVLLKTIARD